MNKYILAKALVLSLALLIFLAPAEWDIIAGDKDGLKSGSAGGPRLIFATESVDFGRLLAGQLATYSFDFINAGDAPLKIEDDARAKGKIRLRTIKGCWPPYAVVGATTYAPGQRGSVFISFTMHEGMEGFHHFEIEIKSNDPVEPAKILTVKADFIKAGI